METIALLQFSELKTKASRNQPAVSNARMKAGKKEEVTLATVDGSFVSRTAKTVALQKGSGLMIGDYFVGVVCGQELHFSQPLIVY